MARLWSALSLVPASFNGAASVRMRKSGPHSPHARSYKTLQWGRIREDAEVVMFAPAVSTVGKSLQWGRIREDAEVSVTTHAATASTLLQWGRIREDAEVVVADFVGHVIALSFNGAASVRMRK